MSHNIKTVILKRSSFNLSQKSQFHLTQTKNVIRFDLVSITFLFRIIHKFISRRRQDGPTIGVLRSRPSEDQQTLPVPSSTVVDGWRLKFLVFFNNEHTGYATKTKSFAPKQLSTPNRPAPAMDVGPMAQGITLVKN